LVKKTLFKNVDTIVTMNLNRDEIRNGYVLVEDNVIKEVGKDGGKQFDTDLVIDCKDKIMLPGFINTHHHLYQSLFRNVPPVQNAKLFDWLTHLYELWKNIDSEAIYVSSVVAISEMMASGVTTTSDMLYLYPKGTKGIFDAEVAGARHTGIRFFPCRGSMSLDRDNGGLPPRKVVQTEEEILTDSERVVKQYHDSSKYSMLRIALAPCSPFSVSEDLMIKTAKLADKYNLLIHTHLAETKDEELYCLDKVGLTPVKYMEKLGWLRNNVWFAHAVWLNTEDIEKFDKNGVGISHCPTSNMRLGSGIAPIVDMMEKSGIRISLGVDGSASNDTGNMLEEIRNTLLLQRVKYGADVITPRDVLYFATMGGARVLKIGDYTGSIEEGKAADLILFDMNKLEFAGGLSDPVAALVMCDNKKVDFSMINGKIIVEDGELLDPSLPAFINMHNRISTRLITNNM